MSSKPPASVRLTGTEIRQPPHPRLASCQKCLRIGDLEEVGPFGDLERTLR